ncbi:MAG: glycosyltransferase [Bacteroidetes bacterium]|nr:glycosyltransferase [Bacteroidota bacterium]
MRLVHVLWNMEIGGAERALFQLVREQRAHGIDADVMVGSRAGYYGEKTREVGARVTELGQSGTFDLSVAGRVRELLREYDVVHFHSAELGLMKIASRAPGIRRCYTHRAGMFRYGWKQLLRYKIAGRYLRDSFQALSGNTSQACDAASRLFRIPRDRFSITYNGIDFTLLDPARTRAEVLAELGDDGADVVRIGTCANLRRLKRIDLLIDAVARIGTYVRCYVIGEGPARAELEEHARAMGVADRVIFTGTKQRMGDYLQVLDLFTLPSGPEESFGNAAVEAMGVGIPTIVFADGGGLREHVEHGVTGYVVRDAAGLASTIELLAADPALRERIGRAGRAAMRERYNPARMVERYNAMYGRVSSQ